MRLGRLQGLREAQRLGATIQSLDLIEQQQHRPVSIVGETTSGHKGTFEIDRACRFSGPCQREAGDPEAGELAEAVASTAPPPTRQLARRVEQLLDQTLAGPLTRDDLVIGDQPLASSRPLVETGEQSGLAHPPRPVERLMVPGRATEVIEHTPDQLVPAGKYRRHPSVARPERRRRRRRSSHLPEQVHVACPRPA